MQSCLLECRFPDQCHPPRFARLRLTNAPLALQEKVVRLRGDGMVPQQSAQVLPGVASLSSACHLQAAFRFKSTA